MDGYSEADGYGNSKETGLFEYANVHRE